jgi:hypothetical protein
MAAVAALFQDGLHVLDEIDRRHWKRGDEGKHERLEHDDSYAGADGISSPLAWRIQCYITICSLE